MKNERKREEDDDDDDDEEEEEEEKEEEEEEDWKRNDLWPLVAGASTSNWLFIIHPLHPREENPKKKKRKEKKGRGKQKLTLPSSFGTLFHAFVRVGLSDFPAFPALPGWLITSVMSDNNNKAAPDGGSTADRCLHGDFVLFFSIPQHHLFG